MSDYTTDSKLAAPPSINLLIKNLQPVFTAAAVHVLVNRAALVNNHLAVGSAAGGASVSGLDLTRGEEVRRSPTTNRNCCDREIFRKCKSDLEHVWTTFFHRHSIHLQKPLSARM